MLPYFGVGGLQSVQCVVAVADAYLAHSELGAAVQLWDELVMGGNSSELNSKVAITAINGAARLSSLAGWVRRSIHIRATLCRP